MQQTSDHERISSLEREIADLKQQIQRILAEHHPYDELRRDIKETTQLLDAHTRYVQARFGVVDYDLRGIDTDVKAVQTGQQELRAEMSAGMQDLRHGQQEIAAGQQQILEFILGKTKTND